LTPATLTGDESIINSSEAIRRFMEFAI
jgi:hypothetical protein